MDYVQLLGTEQVQNAANTMKSAAEAMGSAASRMEYALERHQRWLDNWLVRFQDSSIPPTTGGSS